LNPNRFLYAINQSKRTWRKAAPESNAADQATSGVSEEDQACQAECASGQGVCRHDICYCKSGFEGDKCDEVVLVWWPLATLSIALFLALFGAVFIGLLYFMSVICFSQCQHLQHVECAMIFSKLGSTGILITYGCHMHLSFEIENFNLLF
jgi:hypothetical protein